MSWILYGILSAVFAALVAIFGKMGLQDISPLVGTTLRACIMAGTLVAASLATGNFRIPTAASTSWLFIALSALAGAASWFFYFSALQAGPASSVVALDRLSLVFTAILGTLFLGERITAFSGAGIILIVLGARLLISK
jgi:bacterial/archaeal transporter family protein